MNTPINNYQYTKNELIRDFEKFLIEIEQKMMESPCPLVITVKQVQNDPIFLNVQKNRSGKNAPILFDYSDSFCGVQKRNSMSPEQPIVTKRVTNAILDLKISE